MTIREIAKLAGVSSSAVSRYLNGGSLREEKRQRIRQVIEEHQYTPNPYAQMMRTRRSSLVGVIVPKINSESMPEVIAGLSKVLNDAGYNCLLANTEGSLTKELEYLEWFRTSKTVTGVIFAATVLTPDHRKVLSALNLPLVIVGQ